MSVAHQDESYSYWIDQATCDPLSLYDDVVISYMSDDQLAEINAIDPQARPAEDHSPPPGSPSGGYDTEESRSSEMILNLCPAESHLVFSLPLQAELSTYLTVFSDAVTMMVDFELADMVEQLETGQVFIEVTQGSDGKKTRREENPNNTTSVRQANKPFTFRKRA